MLYIPFEPFKSSLFLITQPFFTHNLKKKKTSYLPSYIHVPQLFCPFYCPPQLNKI